MLSSGLMALLNLWMRVMPLYLWPSDLVGEVGIYPSNHNSPGSYGNPSSSLIPQQPGPLTPVQPHSQLGTRSTLPPGSLSLFAHYFLALPHGCRVRHAESPIGTGMP